jgi:hypothetical protein
MKGVLCILRFIKRTDLTSESVKELITDVPVYFVIAGSDRMHMRGLV